MNKLVLAFSLVFVSSGCHSPSAASVDVGAPGVGDTSGDGGANVSWGGDGGGTGNGGSRWVEVRPDEYFFGIGAVGAEIWGLGGVRGTSVRHIDHRAVDGAWTDTAFTQPGPVPLRVFLPLAADNLYAISGDERTVYHWNGNAWSVLFPADSYSFTFLAGTGATAYLGSQPNTQSWGGLRVSTNGAPFTMAIDSNKCESFLGGFAGNGVAVFSSSVRDCSNGSEIGAQLWLSTGGDFVPHDNKYNTGAWWAASPSDIYAGQTASVAHLHGQVWTEEDLPLYNRDDDVVALAGTSAQDVWALTRYGFLCHSNGSGEFGNWSCEEPIPTVGGQSHEGLALALTAPGDPWVLIDDYRLYHRE